MIKNKNISLLLLLFFILSFLTFPPHAMADDARLVNGLLKVLTAPFYIPIDIGKGLFQLPFGPIGGALTGVYKTTASLIGGVVDMAVGGAPYAKYGLFFI